MNPIEPKSALAWAEEIEQRTSSLSGTEVVLLPSFPHLSLVGATLKKTKLGAQDVFWEEKGPYTGEVSVVQLKNMGISYILVGHSERRTHFGETDEGVNKKIKAVLNHGMKAILCVGEKTREEGEISAVVGESLRRGLEGLKKQHIQNLIIAYEPVWAISTNPDAKADTPDSAFRASLFIRKEVAVVYDRKTADDVRIVYGGSVRKENIESFLHEGKMGGALVGGASLNPEEFSTIVSLASHTSKKRP